MGKIRLKWWLLMLVTAGLLALLSASALAASDGRTAYRALLIGNSNYAERRGYPLADLPSCAYDLKAMGSALQSGTIAYTKLVSRGNLTASGMAAAVADMASWGIDDDDVTVFYYTGHGESNGLVGVDLAPGQQSFNVYTFAQLQSALSNVPGNVIILLDSCYSGSLINAKRAASSAGSFVSNAIAAFSAAESRTAFSAKAITSGTKFHVIASSAADKVSYSATDLYGVATLALTDAMGWSHNGPRAGSKYSALHGDANKDGVLTVAEAYTYAAQSVRDFLAQATKGSLEQEMKIYPSGSTMTLMSRVVTPKAVSNSMIMSRAYIAPGKTLALDCGSDKAYWTSSKNAVATVDPATGVVTAVKTGTATISARVGNQIVAACNVGVLAPRYVVGSIRLSKSALTLQQGATHTLQTRYTPSSARYKKAVWRTSDAQVATVTSAGRIKAVGKGTATITAISTSGASKECTVTVVGALPKSIRLSKAKLTLIPGASTTLTATVLPAAAEDKSVAWKSSKPAVATVDGNGKVTAVKAGKAVIRATTKNGKSFSCTVTVAQNRSAPRSRAKTRSGQLVASANKIYYSGDSLRVLMFFSNRTKSVRTVPGDGAVLVLKLRGGATLNARLTLEPGAQQPLRAGRTAKYLVEIKLSEHPQFKGLDLRGSDARM
jgi:uncharacterized protein YjdB